MHDAAARPAPRHSTRRRPAALCAFAALAAACPAASAYAQEPAQPPTPTTPPKETREQGPAFPDPIIKAQKPSESVPQPIPGRFDASQIPQPLTLAQAIDLALRLQPDVAAAQAGREATEQRERQTQAVYLPFVTPSYDYRSQYTFGTRNQFLGGSIIPVTSGSTVVNRLGDVGVNYNFFNSFRREFQAQQARQSLRSSLFGEQNTRQAVVADVANRYFASLRADALLRVQEAQVARAQNTLEVVRAQVEAGVSRRIDTLQAEADLANAQVTLLRTRNDAQIAQAQLKNSIGIIGGERLTLANVEPPRPDTPLTVTLAEEGGRPAPDTDEGFIDRYADLAFRTRPDIARSRSDVEVSQTGVRLSRVNAGLQVNVSANGAYQYVPSAGNNRGLSVGISYPLFDAGLTRSQVRESQAQVRASEANLTGLRQQVAVEVEQAYRTLSQSRAAIPAATAAQRAAQINYEAAVEARREGVGNIIDVITAQTQLVQAQTNYVQAVYDFYGADAALARAVGQADRIAREGAVTPERQQNAPALLPPDAGGVDPNAPTPPSGGGTGTDTTPPPANPAPTTPPASGTAPAPANPAPATPPAAPQTPPAGQKASGTAGR